MDRGFLGRFRTRTKLIFILSSLLLFAFAATNVVNYMVSRRSLHDNITANTLPVISDSIYSEIQNDLMRPIFVSSLMANDTFLKEWTEDGEKDAERIIRYLREIKEKYGFFSSFFVSERTGRYYHFDGILKTVSESVPHDVWYYDFKKKGKEYDLDVDTNEAADNSLTIFINHRLNDFSGKLAGVAGVGLNMDRVGALLSSYKRRYRSDIYLVDTDGVIQIHPDTSLIEKGSIFDRKGMETLAPDILTKKSASELFEYDEGSRHVLLTVRYIPEFNWFLMVEQDENEALTPLRKNLVRNLIFGFIITCCIIAINILIINHFQGRLEVMATTDKLSGAHNRREFDRRLASAIYLSERQNTSFTLILMDIDHFKTINDTLGHTTGDSVIRDIAKIAGECIRKNDLLVRWGGDEFIILSYSGMEQAAGIAERIRGKVSGYRIPAEGEDGIGKTGVSISCGVAPYCPGDTAEDLVTRVDKALYCAKEGGRNRTARQAG